MKYKSHYSIFVTVICFLLFNQLSAQAEMYEIEGIPFYVEKIEYKPDGLVMLSYEDNQKLVNENDLKDVILDLYFGSEASYNLSFFQLKKFVSNSLANGDLDYAKKAIDYSLELSSLDDDKISEIFEALPDRPESLKLLHYAYSLLQKKNNRRKLQNYIFLLIGVKDSRWLQENSSKLSEEDKSILEKIDDTFFGATFFENDTALRNKILIFEKNVFGASSSIYQKHIDINKNVSLVLPQLEKFNYSAIHRLIRLFQHDRELYTVLMPFVRERLHASVKNALELKKIDKAIEAISLINKDWRTEDTYLLVKRILKEASHYKQILFIEPGFNDLVSSIALQDQKIKQDYLELLDNQVDVLLANNYLSNTRQILGYAVGLRPDPNQENDILRAKEILFLVKNGQKGRAKAKLADIKTSIPLTTKLRFAMSGLYFSVWKYFFAIILLVVVFLLIKILRNPDSELAKKIKTFFEGNKRKAKVIDNEEDVYEDRLFVTNNMEARYNPKYEAYQNCIKELGLPKEVSFKTIKANYRKMMKLYHPDYHPDQSQEDHDKFIRLSELFKEAFELRKELGFPDES